MDVSDAARSPTSSPAGTEPTPAAAAPLAAAALQAGSAVVPGAELPAGLGTDRRAAAVVAEQLQADLRGLGLIEAGLRAAGIIPASGSDPVGGSRGGPARPG